MTQQINQIQTNNRIFAPIPMRHINMISIMDPELLDNIMEYSSYQEYDKFKDFDHRVEDLYSLYDDEAENETESENTDETGGDYSQNFQSEAKENSYNQSNIQHSQAQEIQLPDNKSKLEPFIYIKEPSPSSVCSLKELQQ